MAVRYSKQSEKTGATIGTIISIPKPSTWTDSTNLTTEGDNWNIQSLYPGWLPCDGRTLNVSDYRGLYAVIGNTYGGTSGVTFKLPDYRSKKLMGTGYLNGNLAAGASLTPTTGPGGSTADILAAGSEGGLYSVTTVRELPPSSEVTSSIPSVPPTIGGSATDTFAIGTYRTNGFSTSLSLLSSNFNGTISYSVGPVATKTITSAAPHTHNVTYVVASGGSGAEGDGQAGFCSGKSVAFFNNIGANINQFQREGRPLLSHSHLIYWQSEANQQYASYGNDNTVGNSGLVNVVQDSTVSAFSQSYSTTNNRGTTINKTLNMSDIAVSINDGTVVLRDTSRTDWDAALSVRLEAAEELSLMNKYYRLKYIIKAY